MKTRGYTKEKAIKNDMHHSVMSESETSECPECGCDWYGNKNQCGQGHRTCCNCYQEWWTDVIYPNAHNRIELN